VLAQARKQTFRKSQRLFSVGDRADYLFVVTRGRVRFSRPSSAGRDVVMAVATTGDVLGLGSLLDVTPEYYGTAEAIEATEVIAWTQTAAHRLVAVHPQLGHNALQVALRYLAYFMDRHLQAVSSTAEQRLARTLIHLGSRSGLPTPGGVEVAASNELLAGLSDVSPYTASRTLQAWARAGAVRKARGRVHIISPEKLLAENG